MLESGNLQGQCCYGVPKLTLKQVDDLNVYQLLLLWVMLLNLKKGHILFIKAFFYCRS